VGPYEFQFNGTFIGDYQSLKWYDGYLKNTMINNPGLYDDLYMDLTFVDVFEKYGLDAPVDSFANAFANAGYMLWHANQAARYNLLNGIKPPPAETGKTILMQIVSITRLRQTLPAYVPGNALMQLLLLATKSGIL
jgi:hypothetical protein